MVARTECVVARTECVRRPELEGIETDRLTARQVARAAAMGEPHQTLCCSVQGCRYCQVEHYHDFTKILWIYLSQYFQFQNFKYDNEFHFLKKGQMMTSQIHAFDMNSWKWWIWAQFSEVPRNVPKSILLCNHCTGRYYSTKLPWAHCYSHMISGEKKHALGGYQEMSLSYINPFINSYEFTYFKFIYEFVCMSLRSIFSYIIWILK